MPDQYILTRLRRFLLAVAALMFAGTLVELWLLDHTTEIVQFIPFILCSAGLTVVIIALFRPSHPALTTLRVVMAVEAVGGIFGVGYHLWSNYSFEHEIRPNAALETLILPALKGAAPLMAPGMLLFAALLAIAATYYHPALAASPQAD